MFDKETCPISKYQLAILQSRRPTRHLLPPIRLIIPFRAFHCRSCAISSRRDTGILFPRKSLETSILSYAPGNQTILRLTLCVHYAVMYLATPVVKMRTEGLGLPMPSTRSTPLPTTMVWSQRNRNT